VIWLTLWAALIGPAGDQMVLRRGLMILVGASFVSGRGFSRAGKGQKPSVLTPGLVLFAPALNCFRGPVFTFATPACVKEQFLRGGLFVVSEDLPRQRQHSFRGEGRGQEDRIRLGIFCGSFADSAQNQNRQVGLPCAHFAHKCRPANPQRVVG